MTIYYYRKKPTSDVERESCVTECQKSPRRSGRQTSALSPNIQVKNNDPIHQSNDRDPARAARRSPALARALAILPARAGALGQTLEDISGLHTQQQHARLPATSSGSPLRRRGVRRSLDLENMVRMRRLRETERIFRHLASSLTGFLPQTAQRSILLAGYLRKQSYGVPQS